MPALDRHAGGALIYTVQLILQILHEPWRRIYGLCREKKSQKPAHGPPLQARVVAANRTVLTTCDDPGAHGNEQVGQSKIERGQTDVDEGSRYDMAKVSRHTQPAELGRCRQTQPADDLPGTGLDETTASSWPASRRAVQVGGGSAVVLATQKAGSDLPNRLSPSHLSPLPVTVSAHSLNL